MYISIGSKEPYAQKLSHIFLYNMAHNARTKRVPTTDRKESRLASNELTKQFERRYWSQEGISYVTRVTYQDGIFSAYVFHTKRGVAKRFSTPQLEGNEAYDRKEIHRLTDSINAWLFHDIPIASSSILYAQQIKKEKSYTSEIWEVDCDGHNPRKILYTEGYCVTPQAIPHSSKFFYVTYARGVPKIFLSDTRNTGSMQLVGLRGNQLLPSISANKRTVAFICDASGRADLFVQHFDEKKGCIGKPIQAYSFPSSVQASPTLSPDGSHIAFVSDKSGTPRVYMIKTPKYARMNSLPAATLLSKACRENTSPSWSPDGKKIAYSARIDGIRQIVVYDLILEEEWQVTSGPLHKENPSWAPNSLHLVYNTVDGESSDLFVTDIHQKSPIQITFGPGKKHYPSWGSAQP